jgi:hypothetical protein
MSESCRVNDVNVVSEDMSISLFILTLYTYTYISLYDKGYTFIGVFLYFRKLIL